jgi:hypothetical protein
LLSVENFWRALDTGNWVEWSLRKAFVSEVLMTYRSGGVLDALQLK